MSSYDKVKPGLGLGPDGHTRATQSPDSKQIKCDCHISMGIPAELGKHKEFSGHVASPSRIFTNDYSKVQPEKDDKDEARPAIGNPLIW